MKGLRLTVKKQLFYCKECGQTFTTQTPYIEPRCTISNDVKLMVMKKLAKVNSEKNVADSVFVSLSTVHQYSKILSASVKTTVNDELLDIFLLMNSNLQKM